VKIDLESLEVVLAATFLLPDLTLLLVPFGVDVDLGFGGFLGMDFFSSDFGFCCFLLSSTFFFFSADFCLGSFLFPSLALAASLVME